MTESQMIIAVSLALIVLAIYWSVKMCDELIKKLEAKILDQSEEIKALKYPWIPCSVELPEDEEIVIWKTAPSYSVAAISKSISQLCARENFFKLCPDLTHWMSIPELNSPADDIEQLKKQFPKGVR